MTATASLPFITYLPRDAEAEEALPPLVAARSCTGVILAPDARSGAVRGPRFLGDRASSATCALHPARACRPRVRDAHACTLGTPGLPNLLIWCASCRARGGDARAGYVRSALHNRDARWRTAYCLLWRAQPPPPGRFPATEAGAWPDLQRRCPARRIRPPLPDGRRAPGSLESGRARSTR